MSGKLSAMRITSGPWTAYPDDDGKESTEIRADGSLIAAVYGSEDFPCLTEEDRDTYPAECLANARLIAAAPELYEACKVVKEFLDRLEADESDSLTALRKIVHANLHKVLDSALAKV